MTDQTQLIHRIQSLAEASNRIIIAITGPPASGKSTFVEELIRSLEDAVIVPIAILKKRLIQRWLDHGLSPDQALLRAESNDLPNARLVVDHSMAADSVINNY